MSISRVEIRRENAREVVRLVDLLFELTENSKKEIKHILERHLPEEIFTQYSTTDGVIFVRNEAVSIRAATATRIYTIADLKLFMLQAADTGTVPIYLLYEYVPIVEYADRLMSYLSIGFEVTTPTGFVINAPNILVLSKELEMLL